MGGTHFLQTGYLLLNRNAPLRAILNKINNFFYQHCFTFALKIITFMKLLVFLHFKCSYKGI